MIYIIIPIFNRKDFTKKCLESLQKQSYQDYKIIIVDDGSTDGSAEMIKSDFQEVQIINGDGNLWWTASINLGIKEAIINRAEYVLTLNNDTIAEESFLNNLIKTAESNPNSIIGAFAINYENKLPVFGGGNINWKTASTNLWLDSLSQEELVGQYSVDHLPGRGLLIPAKLFDKIGLFDQKAFPHYFADYDFTHKAYLNGFKLYCDYTSRLFVFPDESGDRKNRQRKSLKNYYQHLFGTKGGGNLKNFTRFTLRNCPKQYILSYLLFGYTKRIFGYLLK